MPSRVLHAKTQRDFNRRNPSSCAALLRPYDALGRLSSLTQTDVVGGNSVADKRVDFAYNRAGQFTDITRYASTTTASPVASTDFSYDTSGRIASIGHTGLAPGSTFTETHTYGYDDANRVTSYTNVRDAFAATYTYDNRGQLDTVDGLQSQPQYAAAYNYDLNGNRIYVSSTAGDQNYTRGANNQIQSDGTYTYEYDNEGNRTKRTHIATGDYTIYLWDHRNRLTDVSDYSANGTPTNASDDSLIHSVFHEYDAHNQLIRDSRVIGQGYPEQRHFVYEGGQVALEFTKDDALWSEASDLSHRYLWGPAVDQLLADEQVDFSDGDADGEVLWALTDHLGSVRDVVDSNGDLRIHRAYDAFGNVTGETHYNGSGAAVGEGQAGYVDEAFGFTGRMLDKDTGLQNNLNRWYDSATGRWLSEDPIGFAAGDENLYRYVGNEPTGWTDPTGLATGYGGPGWDDKPRVDPAPEEIDHRGDKGRNPDPEAQLDEIEKAQEHAKKNRPSIQDQDDEWDGAKKRPKQTGIERINKSEQNARRARGGFIRIPRTGGPRFTTGAKAGALMGAEFGLGVVNDLSGRRLGHLLDNTLGMDFSEMRDNITRLTGPDRDFYWNNIFNSKSKFQRGPQTTTPR